MNVLETLASQEFQQGVDDALELSRANDDREVGFSYWIDKDGLKVNLPGLGGSESIQDHRQGGFVYEPGTGFNVGKDGELLVAFHTHPLGEDSRRQMLAPSISDILKLGEEAHQNLKLAELNDLERWINPVGVISSAIRPELSIFQIQSETILDPEFDENFSEKCRLAVWSLFNHYFPQHAVKASGPVYETFSPGGIWFPGYWTPRFLVAQEQRYKKYLNSVGVRWLIDDHKLTSASEASFEAHPIPRESDDIEIEFQDLNLDIYLGPK